MKQGKLIKNVQMPKNLSPTTWIFKSKWETIKNNLKINTIKFVKLFNAIKCNLPLIWFP